MDRSPWLRLLVVIVVHPLLWVGTEQLRGTLLTGFAWNALGVSQYRNLALIQCASWGGMSAVSALLVAVNGGIALLLERTWVDLVVRRRLRPSGAPQAPQPCGFPIRTAELSFALLLCILCWFQGIDRVRAIDRRCAAAPRWRLALFHPEAPSFFERDEPDALAGTLARLVDHAEIAGAARPDLCIWPETMLPGPPPYDAFTMELVSNATARSGAPLLAGGLEIEPGPGWEWTDGARYYNSAFYFDAAGDLTAVYRKQHLVPFGEYIPGDRWLPGLGRLSPIGYSCSPGRASTIFTLPSRHEPGRAPLRLSPLICFEDTLPYLARRAARAGADLLVNLTNDAWFDGSSEAEQHLAQAVFRCVETGLPMVRSSNSGVSAVILPNGRVTRRLGHGDGTGMPGLIFDETGIDARPEPTIFQKHGSVILSFPGTLLLIIITLLFFHEKRRPRRPATGAGVNG
jgi:apolipoprotein N-acyltransferase